MVPSDFIVDITLHVMEVIRHAELIVEWFLWTIEHTNRSLDNSKQRFAHHGLRQTYMYEARDGRNVALKYQVNYWCARLSKGTILYYQLSILITSITILRWSSELGMCN